MQTGFDVKSSSVQFLFNIFKILGAWVICEPRFTGSREICELWKNVNLRSKFTGKSREPGSHKFGLCEPNKCEPNLCEPNPNFY